MVGFEFVPCKQVMDIEDHALPNGSIYPPPEGYQGFYDEDITTWRCGELWVQSDVNDRVKLCPACARRAGYLW